MPSINLKKPLYDELVRHDEDPADIANELTADYLREEHGVEVDG